MFGLLHHQAGGSDGAAACRLDFAPPELRGNFGSLAARLFLCHKSNFSFPPLLFCGVEAAGPAPLLQVAPPAGAPGAPGAGPGSWRWCLWVRVEPGFRCCRGGGVLVLL